MKNLIIKFIKRIKNKGFLFAANNGYEYLVVKLNLYKFQQKVFAQPKLEDRFTNIYKDNLWGDAESVSGPGSTLKYTENLRLNLPGMCENFKIQRIFDAPCGDFNWMKILLEENPRWHYIGGDIVKPMIMTLKDKYTSENKKFIHIDLTSELFPVADLMICRDCLFHLSVGDIKKILQNYVSSEIPFLLTTTHINNDKSFVNKDIVTGDFRLIDLFSAPYNFSSNVLFRIEENHSNYPKRELCLWSREQISTALYDL